MNRFILKQEGKDNGFFARHRFVGFLLIYTLVFSLCAVAAFYCFYSNNRSFVWNTDGISQHFNTLLYLRAAVRGFFRNLFSGNGIVIQMYSTNLGYGSDVLTTLHHTGLTDPLNLLAAFMPRESMVEGCYTFLIILRLYLSGLAFSAYCFYHRRKSFPTLIGSLLYVFCYWALFQCVRHPFFINPMILLPLLLIGADRIFDGKRPWMFIAFVAITAFSGFYFSYIVFAIVVIYVIFRYFMLFGRGGLKPQFLLKWISRYLIFALTGVALACVVFLPVVMYALNTDRLNVKNVVEVFYSKRYYRELFCSYLLGGTESLGFLGFSGFGVVSTAVLFVRKKTDTALKIGLGLLTLFLLFPFFAHIFNGFSYVSNRFVWANAMLTCYITVKAAECVRELTKKQRLAAAIISSAYAAVCLLLVFTGALKLSEKLLFVAATILLAVILAAYLIYPRVQKHSTALLFKIAASFILVACVGVQSLFLYSSHTRDYTGQFDEPGYALRELNEQNPSVMLKGLDSPGFWRYDQYMASDRVNATVQTGLHTTSFYWSLANGHISEYQRSLHLNMSNDDKYDDLDCRYIMQSLASVKYFIANSLSDWYIPYNFNSVAATCDAANGKKISNYTAYENANPLPLGYTYTTYMPLSEYEQLSFSQRQQAILQTAVLESSTLSQGQPLYDDVKCDYDMTVNDGVSISGNTISVTKRNATIDLRIKGVRNSETYFSLTGLDFDEHKKHNTNFTPSIDVICGDTKKKIDYYTRNYNFYSGIHDIAVNLGYNEEPVTDITVEFESVGIFTFDSMEVICQPMDRVNSYLDARKADVMENVSLGNNSVSGTINCGTDELLCISLPYSQGWSAYVDGKKTELLCTNIMYMGLELSAGEHTIELRYTTPNLLLGAAVSGLGAAALIILIILAKKKRGAFIFDYK